MQGARARPGREGLLRPGVRRAVTLVCGEADPLPSASRTRRSFSAGSFPSSSRRAKRRFPGADTLLFPFAPFYTPATRTWRPCAARAAAYDTVIFCLANYNSLDVLKELKGVAKKVIVISALSPVYLAEVPWVQTAIAVYGDGKDSFRAGFGVLAGDFAATGLLPVSFSEQMSWRAAGRKDLGAILDFLLRDEALCVPFTSRLRSGRGLLVYLRHRRGGRRVGVHPLHLHRSPPSRAFQDRRRARGLSAVLRDLDPTVHSIMGVGSSVQGGRGSPSPAADHAHRVSSS